MQNAQPMEILNKCQPLDANGKKLAGYHLAVFATIGGDGQMPIRRFSTKPEWFDQILPTTNLADLNMLIETLSRAQEPIMPRLVRQIDDKDWHLFVDPQQPVSEVEKLSGVIVPVYKSSRLIGFAMASNTGRNWCEQYIKKIHNLAVDVLEAEWDESSLANSHGLNLSELQLEVCQFIADGLTTAEISARTNLSEVTINLAFKGVVITLNAKSPCHAISLAHRKKLIS